MSIRSRRQLRDDQAALLAEYRARNAESATASGAEEIAVVATVAKVASIVTSDPTYGPHLTANLQEFTGTPPSPADASKPILRVYPTPNHVVLDYSVDEYVLLLTARGALLAAKLA